MAQPDLIRTQVFVPRPLHDADLQQLLLVIASQKRLGPIIFELRAEATRPLQHLVACLPGSIGVLKRVLRDQLPGIEFGSTVTAARPGEVGRLDLTPAAMPLRTDNTLATTRALLSAMSTRLQAGELLIVQVVLGRPHSPTRVAANAPAPQGKWWQPLWSGVTPANTEERRLLRVRAEDASFATTVRVGTTGLDPDRSRRLHLAVQGALRSARAPGVRMEFVREDPHGFARGELHRRPIELACAELPGLLGWPLGEEDLPGLPPLHPAPIRASRAVHTAERVFARSGVPGDDRELGVSAKDGLLHGVALGPSGSGKSTAMLALIEADLKAKRPIAVLDPKRQLIDDVMARVPRDRMDDVVVLDAADDPVVGFNPLDVRGRDPDVVVDGILSVFGGLFTDGWGARTADIFSGTLRTLARASVISGRPATLPDVPRILTNPAFRRSVVGLVAADEGLASFWGWYESLSPQAQANAVAAPLNKLRQLLLRPSLMKMLDNRETRFSLRDIWRENKIVLVPLNEGLIGSGTAELLGSLIVADLWQSIQERAQEPDPERHPGFCYVDEAPRFLHLPTSMADALAVSRSLGVGWFLAAQFARQFGKDMREAVDMNARTKLVFATEYEDARHFARGEKRIKAEDFRSLKRFQAYANLVADGHPQGWALVETKRPSKRSNRPERVMARSRALWGARNEAPAERAMTGTNAPDPARVAATAPAEAAVLPAEPAAPEQPVQPVGRKRRQP